MISEEIEQLKERLEYLQKLQDNCDHQWGKTVYDPETKEIMKWVEDYYVHMECFYKQVPTGKYETIDRWSRTCKKCGLKQYTYESEVVKVKKNPIFK